MFKVHFLRKLMTRGGTKNDAALKVGEKIRLDYGYKNPQNGMIDAIDKDK